MERQEDIDKKENSNGEQKKGKKQKMKDALKRIAVPLANSIVVAAVSSSLAFSCTTEFKSNGDATEETDGRDTVDDGEDALPEIIDAPDAMDTEDINDVISDDAAVEEEPIVCSATNDTQTVFIGTDESVVVGNVTIEYGGLDSGDNGIFRISCEEGFVGTLYIAEGGVDSLDLGGGYSIEIRANTARSHGSNATITVS